MKTYIIRRVDHDDYLVYMELKDHQVCAYFSPNYTDGFKYEEREYAEEVCEFLENNSKETMEFEIIEDREFRPEEIC